MSDDVRCAADAYHGGFAPVAAVVANVGCVHEHVYLEVGVCANCLDGLRARDMTCSLCREAGCRGCPMLVMVLRDVEAVPA